MCLRWAEGLRHRAQGVPDDPNRANFLRWTEVRNGSMTASTKR